MPDEKDEKTEFVRPLQPKLPGGPPPAPAAPPPPPPPPTPAASPPPAPAPTPAPPPPRRRDEDEGATVILTDVRQITATLQRVQPPGRSEIIRLSAPQYKVGRAENCEVRLFTETASREHATLVNRQGAWYLQPLPGKSVIANGSRTREEVALQHKMRLQLGDDELIFFDEAAARQPRTHVPATPAAAPPPATRPAFLIALAVVALAALAWLVLGAP
jgi:pSer/pThr/pTyr-binding forkhead associated (FHA) protein